MNNTIKLTILGIFTIGFLFTGVSYGATNNPFLEKVTLGGQLKDTLVTMESCNKEILKNEVGKWYVEYYKKPRLHYSSHQNKLFTARKHNSKEMVIVLKHLIQNCI